MKNEMKTNPSGDLISREEAKKQISEWATILTKPTMLDKDATMVVLDTLPSAEKHQPRVGTSDLISRAEVKKLATKFFGHWVIFENRIDNLSSVSADSDDLIIKNGKGIQNGLYNIQNGELFKYKGKGGTVRAYKLVPSVSADRLTDEAVQGWIPCSERLPRDGNDYLVVDGDGEMAVGYYRDDADAWDNSCFGWLEREDEDEHPTRLGKVVAWMPLPIPYKGGGNE